MQIVIKKATIKGSLFLSYSFDQIDADVKNSINTSSDAPIHDDLRYAFKNLIPHFTMICEEITDESLIQKAIEQPENYLHDRETSLEESFFKYKTQGFEIKEKDGHEKLIISGAKQLATKEEVFFSSPPISLGDDEYKFYKELQECIETLKEEVLAYMQGKTAPKAQMDMFDEDEDDEL